MKKFLFFTVFVILSLMSFSLFAQDTVSASATPVWLGGIIAFLMGIPKVGPILVTVISAIGVIGAVFTALSAFLQAVLAIPQVVAKWAGAHDLAAKIATYSDELLPWFKYFSFYNVQKK